MGSAAPVPGSGKSAVAPVDKPKTLRLLLPQWQGGNNCVSCPLGARLLAWLAPQGDAPLVEVPINLKTMLEGFPLMKRSRNSRPAI